MKAKCKNLVITGIPNEHRELFDNLCDAMEITRAQFLVLLMSEKSVISGGVENITTNIDTSNEWRELMVQRAFQFACG